jgi:hypothetical protein
LPTAAAAAAAAAVAAAAAAANSRLGVTCQVCCAAGFCVPRMAWTLQAAYAAECPPNTYLQTYFNGKQVW